MSSADSISQDFSQLTLEGPLTPVTHDTITDEQHDSLDEQIMRTFGLYKDLKRTPPLDLLLSTITVWDKRLKTLGQDDAANLLAEEPRIVGVLLDAWEKSSFKEVRHLIVISPVRGLPDDVLSDIFHHCLPSHRNPIIRTSEAPLLLTQICSEWRSLALSSPSLWARLHISFSHDNRGLFRSDDSNSWLWLAINKSQQRKARAMRILSGRVEIIKDWLARSGTYPLSISLAYLTARSSPDKETNKIPEADDPTIKLFEIIISHSHHLKSLELSMPLKIYHELESMMSSDSFSVLTDLKAEISNDSPMTTDQASRKSWLLAVPSIRRLSLDGYTASGLWGLNYFPSTEQGKHLTYFSSHVFVLSGECYYLLKHCDNLVHCRLSIMDRSEPDVVAIQGIIFLPRLQTLILSDSSWRSDGMVKFCSSIDAPSLQSIGYSFLYTSFRVEASYHPPLILPFLENSMQIKKLSLDPYRFTLADIHLILRTVSKTLTHLVIGKEKLLHYPPQTKRSHDTTEDIQLDLDLLITNEDSIGDRDIILPNLKIFEATMEAISDSTLLRLITSRMDSASQGRCAALDLVHVVYSRRMQIDIKKEVNLHREHLLGKSGGYVENPKLDLKYAAYNHYFYNDPLSPFFGLQNDQFWQHPDLDELLIV